MNERFVRCVHCGQAHEYFATVCPRTGKAILRATVSTPGRAMPPARAPLPSQQSDSVITSPLARRDLLGKNIGGKYTVRAILGQGGMGTVYEAEHMAIGRSVALKVLHPKQMRKKEAVKRFHHEARAAGAIGHPNICEVYDLGTLEDGCPYLVMEKLVGKTLADRIKAEGGLPFDEVIDILVQVLSGLVAAHEKSIVHRDIKPENVFLTERVGCPPVAKLLDFGVSKMIGPVNQAVEGEDEMDLTRTGMVMGTPYYMSPEQARGDRNLDARVDLYACGVLLYEAVTGRRPFIANNYNALLLQILSSKPKPAQELRRDMPAGFERVIEKAMSRRRDDRFQTAAEFQRDLQRLRASLPPSRHAARQPPTPSVVELPSDVLRTPSSLDVPVVVTPPNLRASVSSRGGGFDDLPTEIKVADFSDSDEAEPATTLMREEEMAALARSSRRSQYPSAPNAEASAFDPNATEVTKTAVKRPTGARPAPEPFSADETLKMSREEALKPRSRHAPKVPR